VNVKKHHLFNAVVTQAVWIHDTHAAFDKRETSQNWPLMYVCIVYEHWPETRGFITRTIELWYRWIRLLCYYKRVYHTCSL